MSDAPAPSARPRWRRVALWLAPAAAVVAAALWWLRGPAVEVYELSARDFVQTVVASGRVQAPYRVDLGAQVTGTVEQVPVQEGQQVRAGELLVTLRGEEALALERQAALAVTQARARLRQLRELQAPVAEQALRQARVTLDNARSQHQRNTELFARGFIGEAGLDDSRKSLELATAQADSARRQLDSARPAGSDFAIAEAALAQAEAALDAARARRAYLQIRAPRDGVLIARSVEVGDVVQAGHTLMTLSPSGSTQLVVDIDEKNLGLLALGQPALASADAFPQRRFDARLSYINPGVNAQTGAILVKLDVPRPPAELRQDMTVSVDIEVARRPQALVLPLALVHEADGARPWVLRLEDGRAQRRDITLGLRSGGWAEVRQGLAAGDRLLATLPGPASGTRVRARAVSAVAG